MSRWKVIGVVVEGQPIDIGGFDAWSHPWVDTAQPPVYLPHPSHPSERHLMHIYEIRSGEKTVRFAAGELSANVYGFYAPSNNALERTREG
jgi:hypothetical protein